MDVVDYGIRGVHLAYDLLDGRHHTVVLVDAVPLDDPPGTLAVLEVDPTEAACQWTPMWMHPAAVLALLHDLGGTVDWVLVVGCAPAVEERMGLSRAGGGGRRRGGAAGRGGRARRDAERNGSDEREGREEQR